MPDAYWFMGINGHLVVINGLQSLFDGHECFPMAMHRYQIPESNGHQMVGAKIGEESARLSRN